MKLRLLGTSDCLWWLHTTIANCRQKTHSEWRDGAMRKIHGKPSPEEAYQRFEIVQEQVVSGDLTNKKIGIEYMASNNGG